MPTVHRVLPLLAMLSAMLGGCAAAPDDGDSASGGRGVGGGVRLHRDAEVFSGSAFHCTRPAVFDFDKVKTGTAEWQTIVRERVQPGSARYKLLHDQMHGRVRESVRRVAQERGHDLVVRRGDIKDEQGLTVTDLTAALTGG